MEVSRCCCWGNTCFRAKLRVVTLLFSCCSFLHLGARRQGFWHQLQPNLKERLAHLIGLLMSGICSHASAAVRGGFRLILSLRFHQPPNHYTQSLLTIEKSASHVHFGLLVDLQYLDGCHPTKRIVL